MDRHCHILYMYDSMFLTHRALSEVCVPGEQRELFKLGVQA